MTDQITIPADLARDLVYEEAADDCGYTLVTTEHIGHSRWAEVRKMVIRHDETGRLYRTHYRTACCDNSQQEPFEDENEVALVEVFARQKTVTAYGAKPTAAPAEPTAELTRCPSCDHLTDGHTAFGCWYVIDDRSPVADAVCPCTRTNAERADTPEAGR